MTIDTDLQKQSVLSGRRREHAPGLSVCLYGLCVCYPGLTVRGLRLVVVLAM